MAGLPLLLTGGSPSVGALTPDLPQFPNNLVVFPNRDFVTIEGFAEYQGKQGLVEVTREGVGVVGSAIGEMSGDDVAFEINHPGGYCWGEGTGLNVTPDIKAGDEVSLTIDGKRVAATTTLDVAANDAVMPDAKTVVVTGRIGDGVISDQMEQRIIEPALVDTSIARRDVRALPGPMTPSEKGGYSSEMLFNEAADTFKATYIFDVESEAFIAAHAGLGERAMAWEFVDDQGNRQGLTIAENGEPGGPGMGGCPNGPLQSGPPGPSDAIAADVKDGVKVNWTPAVAIPGTPAIIGYRVTAVSKSPVNGEFVEVGRRIMNPGATSTTVTGVASAGYDVNVVSLSEIGETFPAIGAKMTGTDATAPKVSASPKGSSYPVAQQVTLTADEIGSDIYYTIDGTNPIDGDQLSTPAPLRYTGPITIDSSTTLKFAAFDPSNNHSTIVTETYNIGTDPVPAAPTAIVSPSVGRGTVTLNWLAADAVVPGANIVDYQVKVFDNAAALEPVKTVNTNGATSVTIAGLTGDTPYWFTVSAKSDANSAYGPASEMAGPWSPQVAVIANAGADQSGVERNTTVTLSGEGSSTTEGTTYSWRQLDGSDTVTLVAGDRKNASFKLPLYTFPMVNKPLTFELTVTSAGISEKDQVVITPRSDVVTVGTGKWKANDFRISGTSSTNGATVTVRSANGTIYGTAAVTAGAWELRARNGAAPRTNPGTVYVDSNLGGTSAPFTVPNG